MKKHLWNGFILGLFLTVFVTPSFAAVYDIDQAHSSVSFKVKHLFSKVQGTFASFKGSVEFEAGKPESWKTDAVIEAASINTNNADRDKHLKDADFFDTEKFPEITFKSGKVTDATETGAKLEGVLSLHGVEKPVVLDLEIHGEGKDPWGNTRAGFTASTKINRKDFGIVYNKTLDNGGLMLGDEVDIILEIEAVQKAEAAKA